jgi:hypothetical protein
MIGNDFNSKFSELQITIGNKNICLFVYMQIISHDTLR